MKKAIGLFLAAVLAFAMIGCTDKEQTEETTVATTTEPTTVEETTTTEAVTYKTIYKSQLSKMIEEGGVTGGRLVDMDGDGTPEMLVIHNMTATLFTIQEDAAVSIYEGTIGIRYGQTDASYDLLVNESIDPVTLILFNSSDEWVDEHINAVTVSGGAASVKELTAATNGENDTPAREELETFAINGSSVTAADYNAEYDRLTTGADSIDPNAAGLEELQAALNE